MSSTTDEKPKSKFLPWEEAREFIRGELIPSRTKYEEWLNKNKPNTIPRFPYRVYKEWTTWNDFLGNSNKFNDKAGTKWKPFDEAVMWATSLKIESFNKWMDFCKTGGLVEDVPARPDLS